MLESCFASEKQGRVKIQKVGDTEEGIIPA